MSFIPTSGQGSTAVTATVYTSLAAVDRTIWQESISSASALAMQSEESGKKTDAKKFQRTLGIFITI